MAQETAPAVRGESSDGGKKEHFDGAAPKNRTVRPNDRQIVTYSLGGNNQGKCKTCRTRWGQFRKLLLEPEITRETHAAYLSLSKEEQAKLKIRPGWFVGGTYTSGRRRKGELIDHGLLTLDCDALTPELLDLLTDPTSMHPMHDYEFVLYTTRGHTPDAPRARIVLPPTRNTESDEWAAITRLLAHKIDPTMEAVDHVSFRDTQLMYLPSRAVDQEFTHFHNKGELLDPDEFLADHPNWRDFSTLPPPGGRRARLRRGCP